MNDLEKAIKWYCEMLPYPNTGANPHDDRRLYQIAYFSVKLDTSITEELLFEYLKEYSRFGKDMDEAQLHEFAENRRVEIENGRYILSILKDVLK